jgi:hypothetical protein
LPDDALSVSSLSRLSFSSFCLLKIGLLASIIGLPEVGTGFSIHKRSIFLKVQEIGDDIAGRAI